MPDEIDEYDLRQLALDQPQIDAAVFEPFVVSRLQGQAVKTGATLNVDLRGFPDEKASATRLLRISWPADARPARPPAVSAWSMTEWAACGIACVVIYLYCGLRITQVARAGDRFDYWVGNESREYGLEVTGTMTADLESRHAAKVRQLRMNPFGMDGYVVAVGFQGRDVICSFHGLEDSVS